ncbi:MAG: sulfatase-like hydrolase/transferase [Candidatus Latescibacterota bacterium]|nr:sulfatase-like hydrolase/transferase [Candidatus Latescibacterota bacterium]
MSSREQKNVLLICTDHWSGLLTGYGGHPVVMTPTIDQLAHCGVAYDRAYSACPSCIPARRSLYTGLSPRAHHLRTYREGVALPEVPTLAELFRRAGYQTYCVGKLHVSPQRDRVGFDDVLLEEQGRHQFNDVPDGDADDWEMYLAEQGFGGQEYAGGMTQNSWVTRAWHLPERCHPVNWAVREMCRAIRRRDPRKPGFWYLSFSAPHPPLTPLQAYVDLYRDVELDAPVTADWSANFEGWPHHLKTLANTANEPLARARPHELVLTRRAYYATLTHIDHQIRVVLGYLRENGLLDDTVVVFTSDHGHMAGEHGMFCMTPFYEMSAKIPLVVVPATGDERITPGSRDDRLVEFGDIAPTLLDLADVEIPAHMDRISALSDTRREYLYGEHGEGKAAMRMVHDGRYKLIYYPVGNRSQLFDVSADPCDAHDLSANAAHAADLQRLTGRLMAELYGEDTGWMKDDKLIGLPDERFTPSGDLSLRGQRGLRFP